MAKQQSFSDKVRKKSIVRKRMVQLVIAEKKASGHFGFKTKMVELSAVKDVIAAARG